MHTLSSMSKMPRVRPSMIAMMAKVREMQLQLRIPTEHLVRGDLLVQNEEDARLDMMAEDEERIEAR